MLTAILVMAAGASRRMGRPKQLLPFGSTTLLRHAVEVALSSHASKVAVVLGSGEEAMRNELAGLPIEIVTNPEWDRGMGTTIRAGAQAIGMYPEVGALILTVADSPGLSAETYNRIIAAHVASGLPIVASEYAGTVGVPALFERQYFDSLIALPADHGCKALIMANSAKVIRMPCPEAAKDIDSPKDYEAVMNPV